MKALKLLQNHWQAVAVAAGTVAVGAAYTYNDGFKTSVNNTGQDVTAWNYDRQMQTPAERLSEMGYDPALLADIMPPADSVRIIDKDHPRTIATLLHRFNQSDMEINNPDKFKTYVLDPLNQKAYLTNTIHPYIALSSVQLKILPFGNTLHAFKGKSSDETWKLFDLLHEWGHINPPIRRLTTLEDETHSDILTLKAMEALGIDVENFKKDLTAYRALEAFSATLYFENPIAASTHLTIFGLSHPYKSDEVSIGDAATKALATAQVLHDVYQTIKSEHGTPQNLDEAKHIAGLMDEYLQSEEASQKLRDLGRNGAIELMSVVKENIDKVEFLPTGTSYTLTGQTYIAGAGAGAPTLD